MTEKQKVKEVEIEAPSGKKRVRYCEDAEFPTFGHFPREKWQEWEIDCKGNYGNIRWAKAWNDHTKALQQDKEEAMWTMMMELKTRLDALDKKPEEEEPKGVKTLGGNVIK